MTFVFRVDASIKMGTGHVMRSLTLANELRARGCACYFICRDHEGHLIKKIENFCFKVYVLSNDSTFDFMSDNDESKDGISAGLDAEHLLFHANWLGTTQMQDAQDCIPILVNLKPDWLIVDHYALDYHWQSLVAPYHDKLMVIDDLGDRVHIADLLLDQNYGATHQKYQGRVPAACQLLTGAQFALLRLEFSQWRQYSLNRRDNNNCVNSILVTLGGADPDNYTTKILRQLSDIELSARTKIVVVMGVTAPHLASVEHQASIMPVDTKVLTDVSNMAELMSHADLAIGAAGATTWERCCLGLPTIQLVIAENQRQIAEELAKINAIKILSEIEDIGAIFSNLEDWYFDISRNCQNLVSGTGAAIVASAMESYE